MIKMLENKIPVRFLCKYFGVSSSSYYFWLQENTTVRWGTKRTICDGIKEIFGSSRQTYGSPRVYQELSQRGHKVSENTVAKYMKELGLDARLKKKYRVQTTDSKHPHPIADRLLKIEDEHHLPTQPGELLAGDITYLKVGGQFLYLAVVLDLFNREVVGWSMDESLETKIVLRALSNAMKKVGPDAEVIFHSDRGSQYASEAYRKFMKNYNITPSMSRRGNCYDNGAPRMC